MGPIGATQIQRRRISKINNNNKPISLRSVHTQLNELMQIGKVERTINNKYRLTDQMNLTDLLPVSYIQLCSTELRKVSAMIKPDLLKTAEGKQIMELVNETQRILSQVNNSTVQTISELIE